MDHANTGNWSEHLARHNSAGDWWRSDHPQAAFGRKKSGAAKPKEEREPPPRRGPSALLSLFRKEPGAHTKTRGPADTKDEPAVLDQPPSTGRTTALGRKVEKPADDSVAGPSGQKDRVHHDRKHTNK